MLISLFKERFLGIKPEVSAPKEEPKRYKGRPKGSKNKPKVYEKSKKTK